MDQIQNKEHICNESYSQLSQLFSLRVKYTKNQFHTIVSLLLDPTFGSFSQLYYLRQKVLSLIEPFKQNFLLFQPQVELISALFMKSILQHTVQSNLILILKYLSILKKNLIFILVFYGNKICFPNAHKVYVSQSRLLVFIAHCDDSSRLQDLHPIIIIYSQTA